MYFPVFKPVSWGKRSGRSRFIQRFPRFETTPDAFPPKGKAVNLTPGEHASRSVLLHCCLAVPVYDQNRLAVT